MTTTGKTEWRSISPVTSNAYAQVTPAAVGDLRVGFRAVRWVQGHPQLFGPVLAEPLPDADVIDPDPAE